MAHVEATWHGDQVTKIEKILGSLLAALLVTYGHVRFYHVNADPRLVLQPWLLNNGFIQYEHIIDEHSPLLPQLLAWAMPLLGNDAVQTLRTFHALFIALTVFAVAYWLYGHSGRLGAIAGAAYFWAWSDTFGYWGMWHNLALSPIYFFSFTVLVCRWQPRSMLRMVLLGLLAGVAILFKQHAVLLASISGAWVIWHVVARRLRWQRGVQQLIAYGLALAVPIVVYALYYFQQGGSTQALLYWPLIFNFESGYHRMGALGPQSWNIQQLLPAMLLVLPFAASIFDANRYGDPRREVRVWLLIHLAAAMAFLYPRYSIPHWVVALPFLAALSGMVAGDIAHWRLPGQSRRIYPHGLYWAIVAFFVLQATTALWPYWRGNVEQRLLKYGHLDALATELRDELPADGGLVLLPDNEAVGNLYYYLRQKPPHYWVMNYDWFMTDETARRWIETIESEQPRTLLYFDGLADLTAQAPGVQQYVDEHYETIQTLTWEGRPLHIMQRRE